MSTPKKTSRDILIIFAQDNSKKLFQEPGRLELPFLHRVEYIDTDSQLQQYLSRLDSKTQGILVLDLDLSIISEKQRPEEYVQLLLKIHTSHPSLTILPILPENQPFLIKAILEIDIYYTLHKPLNLAEISATINRVYNSLLLQQESCQAPQPTLPTRSVPAFHGMIGISEAMRQLFETIEKVATDDYSTVLIRGESGTGKEMVARAIHAQSVRAKHNFVPVNCAAIPDELLESELFGYTKGAFTGATGNKPGRIQFADQGTLFLDEIGDMKHSLQAKLLRVIQEREFEPVGAFKAVPVNTRILAATHCDLETLVNEGKFREDLYYRLSVIPLHIPALRERSQDIPYLINNFLAKYAGNRGREPFSLSQEALAAILHYSWRGNVRELENLVQQLTILAAGKRIEHNDLPEKFQDVPIPEGFSFEFDQDLEQPSSTTSLRPEPEQAPVPTNWQEGVDFNQLINNFETQLILEAMRQTAGNKKEAAQLLNLKRTTLLEKIKKKEIDGMWEK